MQAPGRAARPVRAIRRAARRLVLQRMMPPGRAARRLPSRRLVLRRAARVRTLRGAARTVPRRRSAPVLLPRRAAQRAGALAAVRWRPPAASGQVRVACGHRRRQPRARRQESVLPPTFVEQLLAHVEAAARRRAAQPAVALRAAGPARRPGLAGDHRQPRRGHRAPRRPARRAQPAASRDGLARRAGSRPGRGRMARLLVAEAARWGDAARCGLRTVDPGRCPAGRAAAYSRVRQHSRAAAAPAPSRRARWPTARSTSAPRPGFPPTAQLARRTPSLPPTARQARRTPPPPPTARGARRSRSPPRERARPQANCEWGNRQPRARSPPRKVRAASAAFATPAAAGTELAAQALAFAQAAVALPRAAAALPRAAAPRAAPASRTAAVAFARCQWRAG